MISEQQDDWDQYLDQACWGIRSTYNESTKVTPYEVMHLREHRFPSELPVEEECSGIISIEDPASNVVAEYVRVKQEEVVELEAKVCT